MTNPVQQSGSITPGHVAIWTAPGIIQDGGALGASQKVLASFFGANFNDTGDQPLLLPPRLTAIAITQIWVTNANVSLTTAVGGFYPATLKAGTPIVAASQVYSSLTAANIRLACTLAAAVATTRYSRTELADWAIYFALTTSQVAPATADIYVLGIDLSP